MEKMGEAWGGTHEEKNRGKGEVVDEREGRWLRWEMRGVARMKNRGKEEVVLMEELEDERAGRRQVEAT